MKSFNLLFLSLLSGLIIFSCSRKEEIIYQKDEGGINLQLKTDYAQTKGDVIEGSLNVNDFKLELINSENVIFKRWKTFGEYLGGEKTTVLIKAGKEYRAKASYGDPNGVGWDKWYFMGEERFSVVQGETKSIQINAKLANVKVAINYSDLMGQEYLSYYATVKHKESRDSLEFKGEHKGDIGYIRPGDLMLYLYVTDRDGAAHRYGTKLPYTAAGGEKVTYNITTQPTPTQEIGFNITIDSTTEDKDVNIPIGVYTLSSNAPKIIPVGFDKATTELQYVEGVETEAAINISTEGGLASCELSIESEYLTSVGFPQSFDLLNLSDYERSQMTSYGIQLVGIQNGATLSKIDFSKLTTILKYRANGNNKTKFSVKVVDNSPTSKTLSASYSMVVAQANVSIADISNVDVWSKSAKVVLTTINGNPACLAPQVKVGNGSWESPSFDRVEGGNSPQFEIKGLTPGTNYQVRGVYNNNVSETKSFATEAQQQIGNSGFEDWTDGERYTQPIYYPWSNPNDKWWDTNSFETMPQKYSAYPNYKCFPTVNYTSGRSGNRAAQVRSLSVSGGNSAWAHFGGYPGKLFIGSTGDGTSQGHTFTSRPTKLNFWFKYESYQNESFSVKIEIFSGSSVIASGTYTYGSTQSTWKEASIPLSYTNLSAKATDVRVMILSSTLSEPSTRRVTVTIPAGEREIYGGSCLTIDDLNLIYEK